MKTAVIRNYEKKKNSWGEILYTSCVIFEFNVTRQRAPKTALVLKNVCAVLATVFGSRRLILEDAPLARDGVLHAQVRKVYRVSSA